MGYVEAVLDESVGVPLPQLHLRYASLSLFDCGQPKQEAGHRRTSPIVGCGSSGEAIGELVVSAILEETPHRPDEVSVAAAQLEAMATDLPIQQLAQFNYGVPGAHGSGDEAIAHAGVSLNLKPRRAKCPLAAEANSLNAQLADYVVALAVF